MRDVTQLIESAQRGDSHAVNELLPIVYAELRKLAEVRLSHEPAGQTLQPTALVHEVYLRLLGKPSEASPHFANKKHFFAAAAEAMRRILIDRARAKQAERRGGHFDRMPLDFSQLSMLDTERHEELIALDEALEELSRHDEQSAELIKLRFYAGLSHQQAAEALNLTRREADRVWALSKAWLFRRLTRSEITNLPPSVRA